MSRMKRFGVTASSVAGQTMQLVGSEDATTVTMLFIFCGFFCKFPGFQVVIISTIIVAYMISYLFILKTSIVNTTVKLKSCKLFVDPDKSKI